MCAYLFLRKNRTCAGLLRTVRLLILKKKAMQQIIHFCLSKDSWSCLWFILGLQEEFCQICHFGCNFIHLRPNLARFRKQIPKGIWEVFHPVCLFGPVPLFS